LTQTFVVGSEVAHLPVLMVRRLLYPEIPTLNRHKELCSALHIAVKDVAMNYCGAAWCCLRLMEEYLV